MQELSFRNDILPLKDKLFRLALRITFDRAEAEDVVQETLIRVWNKRDQWSQYGSSAAYCLTVARNLTMYRGAAPRNGAGLRCIEPLRKAGE